MAAAPRVSIVIVTWNGLELIQRCLPSVVDTAYENLEIVVADNASTDGTAAWIESTYPDRVRVVRHPENWAFCRGNNEAIPATSGKYVVLLNNDVEVPPGWLNPLVEAMEADPELAAVQPKLLQYEDRSRFEYAGAAGGFVDRLGYPFARGRLFDHVERDRGQYDDPADIFWATGAAMMLRRDAFEEVGGLDEQFVLHMEEIDLCWRLRRAGYRIRAVPESTAFHIGGSSLAQGDPRKAYFNFRNSLLTLYKNLPPSRWRRIFLQRIVLDLAALLRFAVLGNVGEAKAVLSAYRDAHRLKDTYREERPDPDASPVGPTYRGSIVFDYFIRGRRRFSELPPRRFLHPGRSDSPR